MVNKKILLLFIVFLAGLFLVGCDNGEENDSENLDKVFDGIFDLNLKVFDSFEITVDAGEKYTVLYRSNNTNVASIDEDGKGVAYSIGTAKIKISLKEKPEIAKEITVTVEGYELSIKGVQNEVFIGEVITLVAVDEELGDDVTWVSLNPSIATVNQEGIVKGISGGVATIVIYSAVTGEEASMKINVLVPAVSEINVTRKDDRRILLFDEVKLNAEVLPANSNKDVIWSSSDELIATVDAEGLVTTYKSGEVIITATSIENDNIKGTITLNVEVDPIELVRLFNVPNPVHTVAQSAFFPEMDDLIYGSVNLFWPADMNLKVDLLPITQTINGISYVDEIVTPEIVEAVEFKSVRPGVKKAEILNIIYHDTGNYNAGAGAAMHNTYIKGQSINDRGRSWHYTVDDKEIYQHLPDDEIAFQGDTYEAYSTTIGIETAINKGSNFFTTWHRVAKLMASLLVEHNLGLENIKQHNYFSGKDCPQVLRKTNLYSVALELIWAEYLVLTELEGYTITFTSHNPEYVDDAGRIIKLDYNPISVSYTVNITNSEGYNKSTILYVTLPALIVK